MKKNLLGSISKIFFTLAMSIGLFTLTGCDGLTPEKVTKISLTGGRTVKVAINLLNIDENVSKYVDTVVDKLSKVDINSDISMEEFLYNESTKLSSTSKLNDDQLALAQIAIRLVGKGIDRLIAKNEKIKSNIELFNLAIESFVTGYNSRSIDESEVDTELLEYLKSESN